MSTASDPHALHEWPGQLKDDALRLLFGREIGRGCYRVVYELRTDPTKVVKVEKGARSFSNVMEWETWNEASEKARRWLAPCHFISDWGAVLIQSRTQPVERRRLPKRMPSWLCDFKPDNYGRLIGSNRIVCHDYGLGQALGLGLTGRRMVCAHWRGESE